MATAPKTAVSDPPTSDKARKLLTEVAPFADSLSKGVAALAIAMYVCGFLTVSLYHANYGFVGTNPFRPRILAAGAWFMFLTAIPVAVAMRYRQRASISIVGSLAFALMVFYGLSNAFLFLLVEPEHTPSTTSRLHWSWIAGALIAGVLYALATHSKKTTAALLATASGVFVIFIVGLRLQRYLRMHDFESGDLALWFFGIFVITVLELKTNPVDYSGDRIKGLGADLFLIFAVLFLFGNYYYPHIKSSWGGGAPIAVTIYFTKDSAIKPNQSVSAQLVEESDEGLYIVGDGENKALYVPRNSVALVYFSENTSDSALLKHENK